jgi:hypothetical protein
MRQNSHILTLTHLIKPSPIKFPPPYPATSQIRKNLTPKDFDYFTKIKRFIPKMPPKPPKFCKYFLFYTILTHL